MAAAKKAQSANRKKKSGRVSAPAPRPPKAGKTAPAATSQAPAVFGWEGQGWLRSRASVVSAKSGTPVSGGDNYGDHDVIGKLVYVPASADFEAAVAANAGDLPPWTRERLERKRGDIVMLPGSDGPLWILTPPAKSGAGQHGGQLDPSPYGLARDLGAAWAASLADLQIAAVHLHVAKTPSAKSEAGAEELLGLLVGLEMGAYRYRQVRHGKTAARLPALVLHGVPAATVERAAALGTSVNLARHLVNVPAAELNPQTFADAAQTLFADARSTTVDVWTTGRLRDEGLGLLSAVGQGAAVGPALVHIHYRGPVAAKATAKAKAPLAFVGKGITFDSGGLDIKDASSMRLMKKDMGGAASVLGLAWWLEQSQLPLAADFYLALAENAVDQHSFRPGDVLTARSGLSVEIDNTDAEGRLVLADALHVALHGPRSQKGHTAPRAVIDLATLTGAMRVALGTRMAGMFATDDGLAAALLAAAQTRGEPAWRMPLFPEYAGHLKSTVADLANSGPGRFGGAITAALFLHRFADSVPWAHFDMYAWSEGHGGGCHETGGSGQCVQLLSRYLEATAGRQR